MIQQQTMLFQTLVDLMVMRMALNQILKKIWWQLVQGTADDNTGHVDIQFKGASSDTVAIRLAGTGHYDGTAGLIKSSATNTSATSGDLEMSCFGTSGSVIIELVKDENFTS